MGTMRRILNVQPFGLVAYINFQSELGRNGEWLAGRNKGHSRGVRRANLCTLNMQGTA
jgi:hypothetical protein